MDNLQEMVQDAAKAWTRWQRLQSDYEAVKRRTSQARNNYDQSKEGPESEAYVNAFYSVWSTFLEARRELYRQAKDARRDFERLMRELDEEVNDD